jgi:hypothetical protein
MLIRPLQGGGRVHEGVESLVPFAVALGLSGLDRKNKHHPLRPLERRFSSLEAGLSLCLAGLRRFGA